MSISPVRFYRAARAWLLLQVLATAFAQGAPATMVVPLDDVSLVESATGIVLGRVEQIEGVLDPSRGRLFTRIRISVEEALKGEFPDGEITVRQIGGVVGELRQWVYGSPEFTLGERVLVFLRQDRDGHLRTAHLFQGKYGISPDPDTGEEYAYRATPSGVRGIAAPPAKAQGVVDLHDLRGLRDFRGEIRRLVKARSPGGQAGQRSLRSPLASEASEIIEVREAFTYMDPPSRWFEPDTGSPVSMKINAAGEPLAPSNGFDQVRAALQAWSNVSGASFEFVDGGTTSAAGFNRDYVNAVSFRDPDGEIDPPSGCSGTLATGGFYASGETRTVGGTTFNRIVEGDVVFSDGWAGCNFYENFNNMAEVATHELGHVLGLGHSANADATMYYRAHWDGRGAALRTDDMDGLRAIYPALDSTPPESEILTGPTGTITATSASFTWTGSDDQTPVGSLVYATRLDPLEAVFSAFEGATDRTFSGLSPGAYTFYVKAKDQAGNEESTPASRAFTVAAPTITLTVTKAGSAGGTVTSSPAGISCGGSCTMGVASGTAVTLTASPAAGASFREWRGACSGTSATCILSLSGDTSVTAVFSKSFTDPTLAGGVLIKAVHFTDLREAITTLRSRWSLGAFAWTDPTLTAQSTPVRAVHVTDLRTALTQAYQAAGRVAPSFAEAITARQTPVRASHLSELRTAIRALE